VKKTASEKPKSTAPNYLEQKSYQAKEERH